MTAREPFQFFCSHLIALCVTFTKSSDVAHPIWFKSYSGTLLRVRGTEYFVTAGHILSDLDEGIKNGVQIRSARLVDSFGPNTVSHEPIPFDEPEKGLDIGVIPLRNSYTRLLETNKLTLLMNETL